MASRQIGHVSKPITMVPSGGYFPDLLYQNYASPPAGFGWRIADNMGRAFRLVHTSEAATMGNMLSNLVTEVACAATKFDVEPIGETEINIDISIAVNAAQYGILELTEGTGAGYMYFILEHTAGTAGTTDSTVDIEGNGIVVATSASDTVGIIRNNPFYNVSVANHANPVVEAPIGRAMYASTTPRPWIWAQTWGYCLLKAGAGACGAGDTIGLAEDVSGAVQTLVTVEDPAFCGLSVAAIANTAWGLCDLKCYA